MKGRNCILFVWVVFAVIATGCSALPGGLYDHSHGDHSHAAAGGVDTPRQESLEYLIENHPTREQMIQARECATTRTGYEFDPLPDDYGPATVGRPAPRTGRKTPNEVNDVFLECVFDLGLEDRFYPPWDHETHREYIAWRAARNS